MSPMFSNYMLFLAVVGTLLTVYTVTRKSGTFNVGLHVAGLLVTFALVTALIVAGSPYAPGSDPVGSFLILTMMNLAVPMIVVGLEAILGTMVLAALAPFSPRAHAFMYGPAR